MVPSSSSTSKDVSGSTDGDLDLESELCFVNRRRGDSDSDVEPPGDLPLFRSFLDLDGLETKKDSSSSMFETVVAAVVVEFERWENFIKLLSPVLVVWVYMDDRLVVDFVRLRPLIEPPKKSPIDEPGRVLNRFREMASRPKIATRERAVGVDGRESRPVRNSNNPN
jgi:hypothetical protein